MSVAESSILVGGDADLPSGFASVGGSPWRLWARGFLVGRGLD